MELTNIIQNLISWFLEHGIKIIAIFIATIISNGFLRSFIKRNFEKQLDNTVNGEGKKQRLKTIFDILDDIIGFFIWVIAILMILPELNVDTSPLLAGLGVVGLGLSFASRDIIQDFLRGFFIILEDQYRIGDFVKIAGIEGKVKDINPRTTILESEDGSIHIISNKEIKIVSKMKSQNDL